MDGPLGKEDEWNLPKIPPSLRLELRSILNTDAKKSAIKKSRYIYRLLQIVKYEA